ncbi:MAG: nucleotidyltransferase domain-containing protein [Candidatus Tectomicrobia bacterium]|uniref:Nucleotidyltransferase domain-containing protein n=1 Tax=Tectimicrobiota bacterium TaxID=2528274 RepID=A0A937W4K2_UNCTE|nr:nucleotidyltransferase domain-containing protein [Candidatus Tectomicrobia bacterium]
MMLTLTADDQTWLDAYRQVLREQFPGVVQDMIIFGSKARGTAGPDSDLDIVVIIREGDWRLKNTVTHPGYDLSIGTDVVPSLIVYTLAEWQRLRERQSVFREVVERDGVSVYETVSNPN